MKTTGEVISDLFKFIKASRIVVDVTPNIFKKRKPLNFTGKCVVINSLPLTANQIQKGVPIINFHVPNLVVPGSPIDDTQPDSLTLDAGEKIIAETLREIWQMNGSAFWVDQIVQLPNDEAKEWVSSFRLTYINGNNTI